MLLRRTLIISTIISAYFATNAEPIEFSVATLAGTETFSIDSSIYLLPPRVPYSNAANQSNQFFGAEVQGSWQYRPDIAIYGLISVDTGDNNEDAFGQGSFAIEKKMRPGIGLGGIYKTQSGSSIQAGLHLSSVNFKFTLKGDGLLYNGFTEKEAPVKSNLLQAQLRINIPIHESVDVFIGGSYGLNMFNGVTGFGRHSDPEPCDGYAFRAAPAAADQLQLGDLLLNPRALEYKIIAGVRIGITSLDLEGE